MLVPPLTNNKRLAHNVSYMREGGITHIIREHQGPEPTGLCRVNPGCSGTRLTANSDIGFNHA